MNEKLVCGNSNMHDLTMEDHKNGISSRCTEENPCECCLIKLGKEKLSELIKKRDINKESSEVEEQIITGCGKMINPYKSCGDISFANKLILCEDCTKLETKKETNWEDILPNTFRLAERAFMKRVEEDPEFRNKMIKEGVLELK